MKKIIINFVTVWLIVNSLYILFSLGRDISVNKLSNYTVTTADVEFKSNSKQLDDLFIDEYEYDFEVQDNYFGAIGVPVGDIGSGKGNVVAQLIEYNSGKVVVENQYSYSFMRKLNNFVFGFPVIENSKGVRYKLLIEFDGGGYNFGNIINGTDKNLLQLKFVFPKKVLLKNPQIMYELVSRRIENILHKINYGTTFVITLVFSILISYLLSSDQVFKLVWGHGGWGGLITKVFDKKYGVVFIIISVLLELLIPFFVLTGKIYLAELCANYVWISMAFAFVWYVTCTIFSYIFDGKFEVVFKTIKRLIGNNNLFRSKKRIFIVLLLFILISGFLPTYQLGGDDTKLFFLYPSEFLNNFAVKVVSDIVMSSITAFFPPTISPFSLFLVVLKKLFGSLNLQSILYTTNIIGGLYFFYILLQRIINPQNLRGKIINLISSCIYVFSVFNAYTLFNSKLLAIFLISMFPLCVYLFIKAVDEKRVEPILLIAVIASVFSFIVYSLPWFAGAVVSIFPIITYLLWKDKVVAIKYVGVLFLLLLVLNIHWIAYVPYTSFATKNEAFQDSVVSQDFRDANAEGIRVTSEINSVFYPLLNEYHQAIQKNNHWAFYSIFEAWNAKILPLNILFLLGVVAAGLLVVNSSKRRLLGYVILSFCVSLYFFTANITSWGLNFFVWLSNNIPGFVLFRNMYDKFGYSMAFSFALVIAVSVNILESASVSKHLKQNILLIFLALTLINIKPAISGEYDRLPIWTTNHTYITMHDFNNDFLEMVKYIKGVNDPSKYLIMPLSTGNSLTVQDSLNPDYYYSGTSPLLVLTGKNDFSGLLSFGPYKDEVFQAIKNKDTDVFGKMLQKLNVKYIIVNHDISPDIRDSFIYSDGFYYLQDSEFISSITGNKVMDFGRRYSLYTIKDKYQSEKIYLTSSASGGFSDSSGVSFKKIDSQLYEFKLNKLEALDELIFLDPYQKDWIILDKATHKKVNAEHFLALGYANGWRMFEEPGNLVGRDLLIYFKPYDYYKFVNFISGIGYALCILFATKYLLFGTKLKKRNIK